LKEGNKEMTGGAFDTYGDMRGAYRVWAGRPDGRSHLEVQGVDGRKQVTGPS